MKVEMYKVRASYRGKSIYMADPTVAHLPSVRLAVAVAAADGAARAEATLMAHVDTGHSSIFMEKAGGPDILVGIEDRRGPDLSGNMNGGAAMGIERETRALTSAFGLPPIRPLLGREDIGFSFTRGDGD